METVEKKSPSFSAKNFSELINLLDNAIDELPTEENYIAEGFDEELDEYRSLSQGGKQMLAKICEQEKIKTGITSLKIKYNRVFGYFFEVPASQADNLPEYFVRRQTLSNVERFITDELKSFESKILSAEQKKKERESQLFDSIQETLCSQIKNLQVLSKYIAQSDVLQSFATIAKKKNFCRPKIKAFSSEICIEKGRHPVVEYALEKEGNRFIPNNLTMKDDTFHLITGPNMGGKSTFLRQNALIVFLAHMGSFVPAQSAEIPLVDQIFTRIGSGDSLTTGESTFLVEMQESSRILRHATQKSFVILDEVGRGTSTYDGLSLAWSITEYLHEKGIKTLFATHYHELITLAKQMPHAKNFSVRVLEDEKKGIIFLHQIFEGGAKRSFGIEVAKLAGLPKSVIQKAEEVLQMLETTEKSSFERGTQISLFEEAVEQHKNTQSAKNTPAPQPKTSEVEEIMKSVDINSMTPLEAFSLLSELRAKV